MTGPIFIVYHGNNPALTFLYADLHRLAYDLITGLGLEAVPIQETTDQQRRLHLAMADAGFADLDWRIVLPNGHSRGLRGTLRFIHQFSAQDRVNEALAAIRD